MKDQNSLDQTSVSECRRLVITLSVSENEILKVEALDETGKAYDVPDGELAALAGDYHVEDLLSALEQVFATGFYDESGDFEPDDTEIQFDDDLEPVVVCRVASHRLIHREVRKLILVRLLRCAFLALRWRYHGSTRWENVPGVSRRFYH